MYKRSRRNDSGYGRLDLLLAQSEWSGANALTVDQLNKVLGAKPGEVANGIKFDKGIIDVMKAYGRQGHLEARVRPKPEFDDSAQKVTYKIEVLEGPQYRMGSLLFKGLSERDAKALRDAWKLRRGEIFDQGYLKEFYENEVGHALQRLFEQRANRRDSIRRSLRTRGA